MKPRLHCFGESGNAYKAALTLRLCGIDWEEVHVDFFRGATRSPEYRALNPMGEVPVLETADGVLTQSGVIQDWAAETSGKLGWSDAGERRAVLRWMLFDNHKVSGVAGPLRFNLNFLPEERRSAEVNGFMAMRLNSALKVMDAHLSGNDWFALGRPSVADTALCGYLYYPEDTGWAREDHPAVAAWLDRLAGLDGWAHPYDLMRRALP
ncbi:glutathione S-transferase [Hasllibacter halocynthiae]|uniref:Glutathione S-transferase n=1 Tax=Hasllibacter halocynthiae TaxID=595589 RepID=A0A2T0X6G1_9RHOB|nr:glutathione S-transferase [Hasllibacter halocynthiae]PRY94519.1 glutathione S-transferase [Hasllibacter halocynthiae]